MWMRALLLVPACAEPAVGDSVMSEETPLQIDSLLPQTQCTRCGFPACLPYAQAIANGEADIDQCPPGGQAGVDALAMLLGRDSKPLNAAFGVEAPPTVAIIDEDVCIGCTKCIQACPVDAIIGAGKRMHTVIAAECTGCELCIAPCPVDCITMIAAAATNLDRGAVMHRATQARQRYESRKRRLATEQRALQARRSSARNAGVSSTPAISKQAVLEAIARGKARRAANLKPGQAE